MNRINTISIMLAIALASLSTIGLSQTKFGFRGGLNLADVSEDLGGEATVNIEGFPAELTIGQSNRPTFNIGGLVEFWFSPMFALQVNALYNQKGFKLEGDINEIIESQGILIDLQASSEGTLELSYLSFPILVKLAFGQSNVKPYLIAGPEIGFLLSANDKTTASATATAIEFNETIGPITISEEQDVKDDMESFEFA